MEQLGITDVEQTALIVVPTFGLVLGVLAALLNPKALGRNPLIFGLIFAAFTFIVTLLMVTN